MSDTPIALSGDDATESALDALRSRIVELEEDRRRLVNQVARLEAVVAAYRAVSAPEQRAMSDGWTLAAIPGCDCTEPLWEVALEYADGDRHSDCAAPGCFEPHPIVPPATPE